jgi:TolB-like protein
MTNFVTRKIALIFVLVAFQLAAGFSQTTPSAGSSKDQERLALLPFETRGLTSEDGIRLRESFATGLAESKRFDVMPDIVVRNNLDQAGLMNIDSCNTLPCLAQLGKVLNVEKVVHVRAERWEQRFMLHVQLVRSSDAALLYDERVDYAGDINAFSSPITSDQGRKLSAAFLDKKPNWILIGAALLLGIGLIFWLFTTFGWMKSSAPQTIPPVGPPQ